MTGTTYGAGGARAAAYGEAVSFRGGQYVSSPRQGGTRDAVQRDPEPSDSLASHLLGGEAEPAKSSSTMKTVAFLIIGLLVVIAGGLAVAFLAKNLLTDTLGTNTMTADVLIGALRSR